MNLMLGSLSRQRDGELDFRDRQIDRKAGATAGRTVHLDRTAVTGNDTGRDGKPEPGTFTDALGGEERLENSFRRRFIHAGARVPDRDNGVGTVTARTTAMLLNRSGRMIGRKRDPRFHGTL